MLVKVRNYICEHRLFAPGSSIVVGVSGGPDSMALLHVLAALAPEWNLRLIAAHVHHGLRPEADADMRLVGKICGVLQIPLETVRLDILRLAEEEKRSVEEMGRICRYRFFEEVRRRCEAACITTAHHQEDAAESILLHMVRGSGTRGLRGILPVNGRIVRPLLGIGKQDLLTYLEQHQVPYVIDSSNASNAYTRNRIRNHLMPLLARDYNPQIVSSLNQMADIIREEYALLEVLAEEWFGRAVLQQRPQHIDVSIDLLLAAHPAIQRRGLLLLCRRLGGDSGWEKKDIDRVMDLTGKQGSNHYARLKHGIVVRKVYQHLVFSRVPVEDVRFCYPVHVPGEVTISETGQKYSFAVVPADREYPDAGTTCIDWACLHPPLFLRSRLPGDRIALSGRGGRKKIKEFFIDEKIPWECRGQIPLLASEKEVYAIIGYRVAGTAVCSEKSRDILVIKTV